jgi:hypothetical protein
LSKIFVYNAQKRPSAREMLSHPWFHMDDLWSFGHEDVADVEEHSKLFPPESSG